MAALQAFLLLVLAAACGLSAAESTSTCELVVDVVYPSAEGGSPYPVCSSKCDSDQSGIWYQGVAFRRYSALRDEYQLMVAADYQNGDLVSCSLVPYKTTKQLLEEAAARKTAEVDCLGSPSDGESTDDLPVVDTAVEPTTPEPTTPEQTTPELTTQEPTTPEPTTPEPTTPELATPEPTTPELTTLEPTTAEPTTPEPTTPESTTPESTTPESTTPEPITPEATIPEQPTPEPTTLEPTTPEPTTPEPTTPEPTTPEPTTPEPTTPEPTTPEPTTPEPTTPEPTTPEPTTPEPTTTTPVPTTTTTTVPTTPKIIPTTTPATTPTTPTTTTPKTTPTTTPTTTPKTIPTTTTPKPIVYTCPSGHYKYKDASCYMLPSHTDEWIDAYNYCKDRGYSLARIESLDEQKFVTALINNDIWIDLNDRDSEGKFRFTDGRSTAFTFWDSGEPNNLLWREDCVEMNKDSGYRWNDKNCDNKRKFVCEKPTTLL